MDISLSGWNDWGLKRNLFAIILFILIVNIVVLLFMGSTLFGAILGRTTWNISFYVMAAIAVLGAVAILSAKKLK